MTYSAAAKTGLLAASLALVAFGAQAAPVSMETARSVPTAVCVADGAQVPCRAAERQGARIERTSVSSDDSSQRTRSLLRRSLILGAFR